MCVWAQLLGLALGAKTVKMAQGHRGANHPVRNLRTNKVEITSQNHGYAIASDNLPDNVVITHKSLFDDTIAGIKTAGGRVCSVQYHPESSPGPHDSHYIFDDFVANMKKHSHNRDQHA